MFLLMFTATVPARTKIPLNTGWRFIRTDIPSASNMNFDDSTWPRVDLPHTWNVEDPWDDEPGYYRGPGWYRRELRVDRSLAGKRLFL